MLGTYCVKRLQADQGGHAVDKRNKSSNAVEELRRKSEETIASQSAVAETHSSDVDARRLLHDMQVYQVTLEARNIEMQQSQQNLEQLLEQYTMLYDFAPIGYVTLDREGRILNINLAGADLVGMVRSRIKKMLFARFVAEEEQPLFTDFLEKVFSEWAGKTTCELRLVKEGRKTKFVQMEALAKGSGLECRIAITDVTELRLEEQKYHIVADNTYDWEFWIAPIGTFIYNSPACLRITGYDPALFLKESELFARIIHPDDKDFFTRHQNEFAQAGLANEVDFRITRADGEIRWLAHACRPVYDRQGNFLGTRGSNRDITERKLVEMIMQARLRISDCIFERSIDELLTKVLDEAETLTNSQIGFFHHLDADQETLSLQAWSSRTLSSICTAEGKGHQYPIENAGVWCDCIREKKPLIHNNYELLPNRKGLPAGHAPVIRELVVPIFRNSLVVAVLGVGNKSVDYTDQDIVTIQQLANLAWDIVERRQVDVTLKESERRFRSLFENMNEGVALHTFIYNDTYEIIDYRIVAVNHAYEAILGLAKETVIGKTGSEAYSSVDPPYLKEFTSVLVSHTGFNFETYFPPMEKHFNISVIPWENTGFATIFSDITERKRNEQQLKQFTVSLEEHIAQAVDEMRQKDQMLIMQERRAVMGEMINNIAHQWRQPLNVLGLYLQDLPYAYDTPEFNREYLKTSIDKSMQLIEHMSQTIDDFMNFFRSDKNATTFSVNEVIRRTLSLIEKSFQDQRIRIAYQAEVDGVVNGYPNEYSQALLNIIINARDALVEHHAEDARILIRSFAEGGKAVVTITDNAGGISDDIIDRLFDPYFTTKGPDKGTGIGLFMSITVIEKNMGGRLTVRNTVSGAEFRIEV
jgi:PAS domain S-box-containing protein